MAFSRWICVGRLSSTFFFHFICSVFLIPSCQTTIFVLSFVRKRLITMYIRFFQLTFNNTIMFCSCTITATDVLNDIAWSAVLDETFYDNYMNDSSLMWQYFASHSGFFRNYPGIYLHIYAHMPNVIWIGACFCFWCATTDQGETLHTGGNLI